MIEMLDNGFLDFLGANLIREGRFVERDKTKTQRVLKTDTVSGCQILGPRCF